MATVDRLEAGKLDRRITIETLTVTQDSHGGNLEDWTTAPPITVWAEVVQLTGRELLLAAQFMPTAQVRFRIRWRADIVETARIVYEGKVYDIGHVSEIGRRDGIEILAESP